MQYLYLTNSHEKAIIDSEDYVRCIKWSWSVSNNIIKAEVNYKTVTLCLFIFQYDGPLQIDHINYNWLDNRKKNLRICTRSQNKINMPYQINNTSGFKGVTLDNKKWRAQIKINQRLIYLGTFNDKKDAACAYNKRAR